MRFWLGALCAWFVFFGALTAPDPNGSVAVAGAAEDGAGAVVVRASKIHGPLVTQLLEAIVQARLPEVQIIYERKQGEASPDPSKVVFTLDSSSDESWVLFIEHQRRRWIRRIPGPERDAAAEEAVAQIVGAVSVELLSPRGDAAPELDGWKEQPLPTAQKGDPSATAEQTPPDAASPGSPRKEKRRVRLSLGGGYRGEPYAPSLFSHGVFASVDALIRGGLLVEARGAYVPPVTIDSALGTFRVSRGVIDFVGGWCFGWRAQRFCPHLGVTTEPTYRSATRASESVARSSDSSILAWGFLAGLRADRRVARWLSISARLAVAGFVVVPEYQAADVPDPILSPHQIRPRLEVGAIFPVF